MAAGPDEHEVLRRRIPQQVRSRGRVERILEVTAELVVEGGVESVNTRVIARAAGIPVASLYQYFDGKDAILLALLERDLAETDREVETALAQLARPTVHGIVESTMRAYVRVYRQRPAFVGVWLRGRTIPAVDDFCRRRKKQVAAALFAVAREAGVTEKGSTGRYAELAVEVSDRLFQIAFEDSLEGDDHVIEEAIAVVSRYLMTHAAPGAAGPDEG
jgi:AcrR family transcriptional regulator